MTGNVSGAIAHHRFTPNVSVEDYVRRKRIELAAEIQGSAKVYLDTKFWLLLRDARLGRNHDPQVVELLRLLQHLIAARRAVCPISAATFAEIFSQTDCATLRVSVELIDELSGGVSVIEEYERFRLEFLHFVREKSQGADQVLPVQQLVWTKLAYVLGFVTPVSRVLPSEIDLAVQKAFVDHMWTLGLTEMVNQIGDDGLRSFPRNFPDATARLNDGKFAHVNGHKTFKQVFLSEIGGVLDVFKPDFVDLLRHIHEMDVGRTAENNTDFQDGARMLANLVYHAFRLDKLTIELPSVRIAAGLHAALRWDRKRKYKRNDLNDFHHAVAAIPYCDFFLTDHGLRNLSRAQSTAIVRVVSVQDAFQRW